MVIDFQITVVEFHGGVFYFLLMVARVILMDLCINPHGLFLHILLLSAVILFSHAIYFLLKFLKVLIAIRNSLRTFEISYFFILVLDGAFALVEVDHGG